MELTLDCIVDAVANALIAIDQSRIPFRSFSPGVGPYGEPQLVSLIAKHLNELMPPRAGICTKRTPDLLIRGEWAIECKLARPFGDNGKPAENWSVNLLHPYPGNTSLLGDCLKLQALTGPEKRATMVIAYEHTPPQISIEPLLGAFEIVAGAVMGLRLGERVQSTRAGLVHPVHQQVTVAAWEVQ